jgi:DNA-binding Xre family transcriptional regulator
MRNLSYDPLWKKLIDLKMTKTELAERVGISRTTISKMGKNEIVSLEIILKICRELDCDVIDVLSILPDQ